MLPCPCGSKALFAACCGPVIAGAPASTAEQLMRSRYSAFATGAIDHIERTAAGPAAETFDRAALMLSLPGTQWTGLEIIETKAGGVADQTGIVAFKAHYREAGRTGTLSERSEFRRVDGAWRYWSGKVQAQRPAAAIGRNDPCPCGSGRKYKLCCGR